MTPDHRLMVSSLIAGLSLLCAHQARASSVLKLTCSVEAISISNPNQQSPLTLSLEQGGGLLIFQTEDYAIDTEAKTASSTIVSNNTVVDSFAVSFISKDILNLTKVALKVDTGARALVTIDRRTGQFAKKEWTIDSSGQAIGAYSYYIGICGNKESSRF